MGFLDSIIDIGSSLFSWYTGDTAAARLARTVTTGYALNQVSKAIAKEQKSDTSKTDERGVRLQTDPDPNAKIPVVYGKACLGGILTDAQLTNANQTMWYCLTICEVTGNLNLGQGAASTISFKDVYRDNLKLVFDSDGVTVSKGVDPDGVENTEIAGLIKVYKFSNGSNSGPSPTAAANLMPEWTGNHAMTNLCFALIRVDYNRDKNVTAIGDFKFVIENSMTQPGDCLYDYMTNTRYGAGIDPSEIYAQ